MDFKHFFEQLEKQYTDPEMAKDTVAFQLDRLKQIGRENLLKNPDIRIIDIGSWEGARVQVLRDMGYRNSTGIEAKPKRAEKNPELVQQGMAHELPFDPETVDLILMSDVFSDPDCSKDDEYRDRVLSEFARVLRQNGIVSINESDISVGRMRIRLNEAEKLFNILENDTKYGSLILEKK